MNPPVWRNTISQNKYKPLNCALLLHFTTGITTIRLFYFYFPFYHHIQYNLVCCDSLSAQILRFLMELRFQCHKTLLSMMQPCTPQYACASMRENRSIVIHTERNILLIRHWNSYSSANYNPLINGQRPLVPFRFVGILIEPLHASRAGEVIVQRSNSSTFDFDRGSWSIAFVHRFVE